MGAQRGEDGGSPLRGREQEVGARRGTLSLTKGEVGARRGTRDGRRAV